MKYKCPCCGSYTYEDEPNGNYNICPVCFWEDDPVAYDDIKEVCSCNGVSLVQAQKNFLLFGASRIDMKQYVRNATADEMSNQQ